MTKIDTATYPEWQAKICDSEQPFSLNMFRRFQEMVSSKFTPLQIKEQYEKLQPYSVFGDNDS